MATSSSSRGGPIRRLYHAIYDVMHLEPRQESDMLTCMFPNPVTKKQQKKLIYVKKVDNNWFLGSGLYQ